MLVTSGPTHEPIDPVRFIANRSSGKQGHAIAEAALKLGARVTLISGPVSLPDPEGVDTAACGNGAGDARGGRSALPADIAVFAAAVADWRVEKAGPQQDQEGRKGGAPSLDLAENPDILKSIAARTRNVPRL